MSCDTLLDATSDTVYICLILSGLNTDGMAMIAVIDTSWILDIPWQEEFVFKLYRVVLILDFGWG